MPDSSQPPAAPAAGGSSSTGFVGALKSKFGPLPTWAWLALITVVLLGYWLLTKNKSSSGSSGSGQQGSPADVGQPGVVVINQDGPEPPQQPGPPIPLPPNRPPQEPSTRQITLTQDETLGQLAKQRHWSDATLKRVEEMNLTQGGGEYTPKTKLKAGQTIVRPINS